MLNDMPDLKFEIVPVSKIKYPFAKTMEGEFIGIEDAIKGTEYLCWGCESPMFKRRSKLGKFHFYHKGDTCSQVTAIHEGFKGKLFQLIDNRLRQNNEPNQEKTKLNISWNCAKCIIYHKGNLLGPIKEAKLEKKVDRFRPDISLYRSDKSVYAAIEIEYTHDLEEGPRSYYNRNNIGIIVFKPSTLEDLKSLEIEPLTPYSCDLCKHSTQYLEDEIKISAETPSINIPDIIENPFEVLPQANNGPLAAIARTGLISTIGKFISNIINRIWALLRRSS
jgi:hypothetical protein